MPIPFTTTRLSQSLSLIAMHQTSESGAPFEFNQDFVKNLTENLLSGALNLAEFAASIKPIGATWSFRVDQSKTNYQRRGINSPIEPFAVVPGSQTTSLTMERAVLYLQDAMAAFSFVPGNIAHQTRPLIIVENVSLPSHPADEFNSDGSLRHRKGDLPRGLQENIVNISKGLKFSLDQTSPIIYLGCWIRESSIDYGLRSGDQMVVQNITLDVTRVVQPLSLVPILGEELQATLAENISIVGALNQGTNIVKSAKTGLTRGFS
jgi:hypothetical protein